MTRPRVVPVLQCDGEDLVVTKDFRPHRYAGDPLNCLRIFNEKEADEIIVLDITASADGRRPDAGWIRTLAAECFMPLTYGGGVRTFGDAESILRAGVERIALTSAAADYALIRSLAAAFGSQSVVAGVDVMRAPDGSFRPAVVRAGRTLPITLTEHIRRLGDAGAGEILLHDVARDGSKLGYDMEMLRVAAASTTLPVVILGGARGLGDFRDAIRAGAAAAAGGACFLLHGRYDAVLPSYPAELDITGLLT